LACKLTPTGFAASTQSTTQINLSWTSTGQIMSGYRLLRGTTLLSNLSSTTTSYNDTGLSSGTTYSYSLVAVAQSGIESISANVSGTTQSPASSGGGGGGGGGGGSSYSSVLAPMVATPIIGNGTISFSWTNPTNYNFLRVRIVRKINTDPTSISDGTIVYEGTGTSTTDTQGLVSGTQYHYAFYSLDTSYSNSTPQRFTLVPSGTGANSNPIASTTTQPSNNGQVLSASITQNPITPTLTRTLSIGSDGDDVRTLQQILNLLGYPVALSGTGSVGQESTHFGPATEKAVKSFQKDKGIVSTGGPASTGYGLVGAKTRAILISAYVASGKSISSDTKNVPITPVSTAKTSGTVRILRAGMSGDDVLSMQTALREKGYFPSSVQMNGNFGPVTLTALKGFQCKTLKVCTGTPDTTGYGLLGPRTKAALGM
jgi:peptidoglycan hydrolase-like protein with peptidoglycan-binding domain